MTRRLLLQSVVVAALWVSVGCGYSLAGRGTFLPPHIRVIGVPTFTNLTSVVDIERRVTERVVSELNGRGKFRVERTSTGVDAVLSGEISSITTAPAAVNAQNQASRYAVVLTAKVEFRDQKNNEVIWSHPALQFRDEYDNSGTGADPNAFFGQDVNALERLATEFARTLVSAILEAF
jgi:outer membrane lipopolysaccharide assembly protein LptE/RlpB